MIAPKKPAFRLIFENQRGGWSIADAGGIVGNYATEADASRAAACDPAQVESLTFERLIALSNWYLHESDFVTLTIGRPDLLAWVAWAHELFELAASYRPSVSASDSVRRFHRQIQLSNT